MSWKETNEEYLIRKRRERMEEKARQRKKKIIAGTFLIVCVAVFRVWAPQAAKDIEKRQWLNEHDVEYREEQVVVTKSWSQLVILYYVDDTPIFGTEYYFKVNGTYAYSIESNHMLTEGDPIIIKWRRYYYYNREPPEYSGWYFDSWQTGWLSLFMQVI